MARQQFELAPDTPADVYISALPCSRIIDLGCPSEEPTHQHEVGGRGHALLAQHEDDQRVGDDGDDQQEGHAVAVEGHRVVEGGVAGEVPVAHVADAVHLPALTAVHLLEGGRVEALVPVVELRLVLGCHEVLAPVHGAGHPARGGRRGRGGEPGGGGGGGIGAPLVEDVRGGHVVGTRVRVHGRGRRGGVVVHAGERRLAGDRRECSFSDLLPLRWWTPSPTFLALELGVSISGWSYLSEFIAGRSCKERRFGGHH